MTKKQTKTRFWFRVRVSGALLRNNDNQIEIVQAWTKKAAKHEARRRWPDIDVYPEEAN